MNSDIIYYNEERPLLRHNQLAAALQAVSCASQSETLNDPEPELAALAQALC